MAITKITTPTGTPLTFYDGDDAIRLMIEHMRAIVRNGGDPTRLRELEEEYAGILAEPTAEEV